MCHHCPLLSGLVCYHCPPAHRACVTTALLLTGPVSPLPSCSWVLCHHCPPASLLHPLDQQDRYWFLKNFKAMGWLLSHLHAGHFSGQTAACSLQSSPSLYSPLQSTSHQPLTSMANEECFSSTSQSPKPKRPGHHILLAREALNASLPTLTPPHCSGHPVSPWSPCLDQASPLLYTFTATLRTFAQ